MKKICAVLAVCALMISGAFAIENIYTFTVGIPTITKTVSSGYADVDTELSGVSIGFAGTSMYSDLVGFQADFSYSSPDSMAVYVDGHKIIEGDLDDDVTALDISMGIAIRPYNRNNLSVFVVPNIGYCTVLWDSYYLDDSMLLGIGCDITVLYKLTDNLAVNAGIDFDYYMTDLFDESGYDNSGSLFAPKFGISICF